MINVKLEVSLPQNLGAHDAFDELRRAAATIEGILNDVNEDEVEVTFVLGGELPQFSLTEGDAEPEDSEDSPTPPAVGHRLQAQKNLYRDILDFLGLLVSERGLEPVDRDHIRRLFEQTIATAYRNGQRDTERHRSATQDYDAGHAAGYATGYNDGIKTLSEDESTS